MPPAARPAASAGGGINHGNTSPASYGRTTAPDSGTVTAASVVRGTVGLTTAYRTVANPAAVASAAVAPTAALTTVALTTVALTTVALTTVALTTVALTTVALTTVALTAVADLTTGAGISLAPGALAGRTAASTSVTRAIDPGPATASAGRPGSR